MSVADNKYKELILDIYNNGTWDSDKEVRAKYADRTPAYCKSVFGKQVIFEPDELPLVTCKQMYPITALKELYIIWIKQSNKVQDFKDINCNIWNEWELEDGTIGKSYAYQFQASDGRNQVKELLHNIVNNPASKRLMTSFWNYNDVQEKALQECAWTTQWYTRRNYLDLMLIQRSADTGLGIPFNWFQYKALQILVSKCTGYKPGRFIHQMGCVHYYDRHEEDILKIIDLKEFEQPELILDINKGTDFFSYNYNDFKLNNYQHGPSIPFEIAI